MVLHNFSLYQRERTVEVDFEREVFCLAGANGLGKSTFLAALSYAMTGAVARPDLDFLGASKYYKETLPYSARFFEGRINPADHDVAEVELEMAIGAHRIVLVRGMFSPEGLRELRIDRGDGELVDLSGPETTESERHDRYVEAMLEATGLESFAQLVFLQLFVLTFDEHHRLLFWSDRIAEQALFLAFGISPQTAVHAEALQRTYDSAESKARNLQWQATGVRKRLKALEEAVGGPSAQADETDTQDLQDKHIQLTDALAEAGAEHARLIDVVREAELALDEAVAGHVSIQGDYERAYRARIGRSHTVRLHPLVIEGLKDRHCGLCGAKGKKVNAGISAALDEDRCPMCESELHEPDAVEETQLRKELTELADRLVACEAARGQAEAHLARQRKGLEAADGNLRDVDRELEVFRAANTQALLQAEGERTVLTDARHGMKREIADLLAQKDKELKRRNEARAALDGLRRDLTGRFTEMEHEFVPLLQDLAHEFLGVPLQVDLERRGPHVGLQLAFAGSQRSTPDMLSESQRYFMDIALRMALARKLSQTGEPATLYIDTPEGSLDIAYERRAGRMFGRFADEGNRILMTANINSSQLLQELALVCRRKRMSVVRMTEWTELTEVQQEAEDLFERAYTVIERRLDGKRS